MTGQQLARRGTGRRAVDRVGYEGPREVMQLSTRELGGSEQLAARHPVVYAAGHIRLLEASSVAILGARQASPESVWQAGQLARDLVRSGLTVMSGLAGGIDVAAQLATLEQHGHAVAVIGTPLDRVYPSRHAELQQRLCREQLVLTLQPTGGRASSAGSRARGQLVAQLATATVIIEARETGDLMHQVDACNRSGRPVFIAESMLRRTDVLWPRCYLDEGRARLLSCAEDLLDEIWA